MPQKKTPHSANIFVVAAVVLIGGFIVYSINPFFTDTKIAKRNYASVLDGRRLAQTACPPHCPIKDTTDTSGSSNTSGGTKTPTKTPIYTPVSTPIQPKTPASTATDATEESEIKEYSRPRLTVEQTAKLNAGGNPYIKPREPKIDVKIKENPREATGTLEQAIREIKDREIAERPTLTVKDQDGDGQKIDKDTQIKVVFTFDEAAEELSKLEKNVKLIYPGVDSDSDGIDDITEIIEGTNLFNADTDFDGITDTEEILDYGTDPTIPSEKNLTPGVVNLDNHNTGPKPPIKGKGYPGIPVTIIAENIETGEKVTACVATPDEAGKFFCEPTERLNDGQYFLYSNHQAEDGEEDTRKIAKITVDKYLIRHTLEAEIVEVYKSKLLASIKNHQDILEKFIGERLVKKVLSKPLEFKYTQGQPKIQKLQGTTLPGETVVATFESFILSSAVISDASQGTFELPISKKLEIGNHRIYVYSFNAKSKFVSNITQLIFSKI